MSATKQVGLIAAVAANGVIGAGDALPWRLSEDLRHFARTTMGQAVIMGRRTHASIGAPLKGRSVIVLSRRQGLELPGCQVACSLEDGLAAARGLAGEQIWIAGGAQVYAQAIELADLMLITHIDREYEGDSFFPAINPRRWHKVSEAASESSNPSYIIARYLSTSPTQKP